MKPLEKENNVSKMKKILFALFSLLCLYPLLGAGCQENRFSHDSSPFGRNYGVIEARAVKVLMDSEIPFVLLDARGGRWKDPNILPGAQFASYESSEEEIAALVPNKNSLVVVYCYSAACPLGNKLIERLVELGYRQILYYPGGLNEWRDIAQYGVDSAI